MSNAYREWERDRGQEAWTDLLRIAELWEELSNVQSVTSISAIMDKIDTILKEGEWI